MYAALDLGHVLVVAPPGAGKTTLLAQLVAGTDDRVAWYTAGPEDSSEAILVDYLGRAMWGAATGFTTMAELLDALDDRAGDPVLLVLDDVHELARTPAEDALELFLTCQPSGIRVLMASRRLPEFNVPRMMASGGLVEFSGDDLRFRSWEVEALFRDVHHTPLSPESAARLTHKVGGLAAALQLFHLSTRGHSRLDREAEIRQLSGRTPLIRSYLARTALDSLSPERRDFLLRTSVLGVLDGQLCDALLEVSGSAGILGDLARDQVFTTTVDGGRTYHYHPLLRNHLAVTLEDELPATTIIGLHLRAGQLLEEAGHAPEAVRAYERAGDWGSASRLIRRTGVSVGFGAAPRGATDDPWLALGRARRLIRRGSIEAGLAALAGIEKDIDDPDLARRCAEEKLQIRIWQRGPLRLAPAHQGQPLAAIRALTHRPTDRIAELGQPPRTETDRLIHALASLVDGDFPAALDLLARPPDHEDPPVWVRLVAALVAIVLDLDEPDGVARCAPRLEDLQLTAEVAGYPWLARLAHGVQACVVVAEDAQPWRRHACEGILESCRRDGDHWGELLTQLFHAVVLGRLDLTAEAAIALTQAAELARQLDAPMLRRWAEGYLAVITPTGPALVPAGLVSTCRTSLTIPPEAEDPVVGRLGCLGGFQLVRQGRLCDLTPLRPRTRLLLMRLAIQHGHDVHREQLIDNLWPEATLAPGLRRLQVAVSSLRQWLGNEGWGRECLERHGDAYRLELPGAESDIQLLEAEVAAINRNTAPTAQWVEDASAGLIRCHGGELLPEVGAADWVLAERDRLRLITAGALAKLARAGLSMDRPDLALEPAQQLVQLDPFRDTAWLLLARIERTIGDHNAAEQTMGRYRHLSAEWEN